MFLKRVSKGDLVGRFSYICNLSMNSFVDKSSSSTIDSSVGNVLSVVSNDSEDFSETSKLLLSDNSSSEDDSSDFNKSSESIESNSCKFISLIDSF